MHVTRQSFITSCSNIILTYLLIYSVVDLVWLPDLDLSGFLPRRGGVRPAWMGCMGKCTLGWGVKFVPSAHVRCPIHNDAAT